ncbi:MAG: hypothetical protein IKE90_01440 [Bacilli bacterium]|nr:hypothetical protein [Bacilli bacterium]
MGHIIGYIIASIVATVISGFLLLGIPFGVLLEMKGLGDYMYALTIIIASVFELGWLILTLSMGGNVSFSPKKFFTALKSFIKREKKETNKGKNVNKEASSKVSVLLIVEAILLLAIAIYSVMNPMHSSFANIIYNGTITKILAGIFIPLIIINIINMIVDMGGGFGSIFTSLGSQLGGAFMAIVFGFIISTGMLFVASVWYTDIETTIKKTWFVYDNSNFNEIRGTNFNADEYLKTEYQKLNDKYKQSMTCNINEENCMKELKLSIVREIDNRNAEIRNYGYMYKSRIEVDTNTDVLCITDMKTTHNLFYKINYRDFSFDVITLDEYNSHAGAK